MSIAALTNEELIAKLSKEIVKLGDDLKDTERLFLEAHAEVSKLKRQMDNLYFAYDRLRMDKTAETELWKARAEAMADPKPDSEFTSDQVDWREMAVAALKANGWKGPE